jgi:xanthine dehydrogenase accessory factor
MYVEIASALARGEAGALFTVVRVNGAAPCGPGTKVFVRADGSLTGTLGGATTDARAREDGLKLLADGQPTMLTYHLDPESGESVGSCGATLEIFAEPVRPEPRLIVAGSGYVAQSLARLAIPLGWRVTLLDDRSEFVRAASLPDGVSLAVGEIPEQLPAQAPDPMTAVVVVTRGHRVDREALQAALGTPVGYVGMIGSPSKVRNIFRALLKEGVAPDTLARVRAPIGLDLGAQTPDEIALSIAAELLAWRRGGTAQPLRDRQRILEHLLAEKEAAPAPA